jgi:hypothetical protein
VSLLECRNGWESTTLRFAAARTCLHHGPAEVTSDSQDSGVGRFAFRELSHGEMPKIMEAKANELRRYPLEPKVESLPDCGSNEEGCC